MWLPNLIFCFKTKCFILFPVCKISENHLAQLVATSSNHHYVRSVDIYPKCDENILLAVGLANGRVALTTFGPSEYDVIGYPGKEFG